MAIDLRYSVIIPVFNRAHTLRRAIASVFAQTVLPYDIIIVDDGSEDDSVSVAQELAAAHGLIQVVQLDRNEGAPTARNIGAVRAQGDILSFFDSDDEWMPTKAERQLALLERFCEAPAAFTRILVSHIDGRQHAGSVSSIVRRPDLFESNILGGTSSVMVRRSSFDAVGGFRLGMPSCQDWELWLRLSTLGPLVVCQDPLTVHHLDAGNRITARSESVIEGQRRITEQLGAELSGRSLDKVAAAHAFNVASILSKQAGQPGVALRIALRGWLRSPSLKLSIKITKLGVVACFFPR